MSIRLQCTFRGAAAIEQCVVSAAEVTAAKTSSGGEYTLDVAYALNNRS